MAEGLLQGQRAARRHLSRERLCCESMMSVPWPNLAVLGGWGNRAIEMGQNNIHTLTPANSS